VTFHNHSLVRSALRIWVFAALLPLFARADIQQIVANIPAGTPNCVADTPAGYPKKACKIVINRDTPVYPATTILPAKTIVYIELDNARWDETVTWGTQISQAAIPKFAADALGSLASPLSSLQGSYRLMDFVGLARTHILLPENNPAPSPQDKAWQDQRDLLMQTETDLGKQLTTINNKVVAAMSELKCLETYRTFVAATGVCNTNSTLDHVSIVAAFQQALLDAAVARDLDVPQSPLNKLGTDLTAFDAMCQALANPTSKSACVTASSTLQSTAARFTNTVKDIQTAQDTLRTVIVQIGSASPITSTIYLELQQPFMRTATVTISATEVLTTTATTIGPFTISWQESGFLLSTGLMGSGLPNKTYALSSVIVNGVVQTDSGTPPKNLSIVTATTIKPAMDLPAVFGSWVIPWINRWAWENNCPGHCGFLLSAGTALNLTTKTADFAVGPSLQVFGLLITPSIVWGRQTVLMDGITQGYTGFGSNPPTSLPTETAWKKAFGIALTYTIPTP
jgi:hypothetical protein